MKKIQLVLGASACLLLASSGVANAQFTPDSYVNVGIDGGYAMFDLTDDSLYQSTQTSGVRFESERDNNHIMYGAHLGYNVDVYDNFDLGLELAYRHNGEASYDYSAHADTVSSDDVDIDSSDLDLTLKGAYQFEDGFKVYAKGGFARVDQDIDKVKGDLDNTDNPASSPSRSITEYTLVAGAGLKYQFSTGIGIGLSAEHVFGKDPSIASFRSDSDRGKDAYAINRFIGSISYRFQVT